MVSSASFLGEGGNQTDDGSTSIGQSRSSSASPRFPAGLRIASPAGLAGFLPTISSASTITGLNGVGSDNSFGLGESPSSRIKSSSIFAEMQDSDALSIGSSPRSPRNLFPSGLGTALANGHYSTERPNSGDNVLRTSRSSSLAPGSSSSGGGGISLRSSSLALPKPVGSGSPRERERLYERGGGTSFSSSASTANAFSSSFPNSNMWLNERPAPVTAGLVPSASSDRPSVTSRSVLSRHLSLSGSKGSGINFTRVDPAQSHVDTHQDLREGRSRTRLPIPSNSNGHGKIAKNGLDYGNVDTLGNSLTVLPGRNGSDRTTSGIELSNRSPFLRDIGQLPPLHGPSTANPIAGTSAPAPHPYSASYTATFDVLPSRSRDGGIGGNDQQPPASPFGNRDFSLGAVGSGRRRRESYWGDNRALREGDEEGRASGDENDKEDYAPPTRSGATSRRHSVAAFTSGLQMTNPPMRSQIGFHLPGDGISMTSTSSMHGSGQGQSHGRSASSNFGNSNKDSLTFLGSSVGRGGTDLTSRLDDEDLLATDLSNALQLNLEAQAAKQHQEQSRSRFHLASPRPSGTASQAVSLPAQPSSHFSQEGTSPYDTGKLGVKEGHIQAQGRQPNLSISPPRSRPGRASSTSGDPYSPSASAARFLATAHHIQPPPLQQTSATRPYPQLHSDSQGQNAPGVSLPSPSLWPPPGANIFSAQSPHFRSGTLPPPESLPNFMPSAGNMAQNQGAMSLQHQSIAASAPPAQFPESFNHSAPRFGFHSADASAQPPSPILPSLQLQMQHRQQQPRSAGIPPFAGFGGMAAYQHSGPTQTISHLNAHAQPYYVAPIAPQPSVNDLGRGVPLHALPAGGVSSPTTYIVCGAFLILD